MRSSDPAQARNETILLGGMIGSRAAATVGDGTVAEIFRYRADLALLSPVGVDAVRGATNYDRMETEVARAMVSNAADVAILPISASSARTAGSASASRRGSAHW